MLKHFGPVSEDEGASNILDQLVKMMELVEMTKQTFLIRERTISNFMIH